MPGSLALSAYLLISELLERPARALVTRRFKDEEIAPGRIEEFCGHATLPRPQGVLVWFHAASVGESVSLLDLINALLEARKDVRVLVTTSTPGSADVLSQRLPDRAFHQFFPVDAGPVIRRFLAHWKPDLAIWTEGEFWPALIHHTHKSGCPMLLINARISARSAGRFRMFGGLLRGMLGRFDLILAQDDTVADRFYRAGVSPGKIMVTGSLKDSAQPLPHDPAMLKSLTAQLSGRKVWLAASTHEGEEEKLVAAHKEARKTVQGLLMILAPRHTARGAEVAQMLRAEGWQIAVRSEGAEPDRNTEIYLADTMGEMGLWYRLASVSFIGGSLEDVGGHNPFEPALLGSAIIYGPHVRNFEAAYARFDAAEAAIRIPSAEALPAVLVDAMRADRAAALATAAWGVSSEGADVLQQIRSIIDRHLPPPARTA